MVLFIQVHVKYRQLKESIDKVRNLFGNALVAFYLSAVANYAESPHLMLGSRGDVERLVMIYFGISGVMWLIAAEFHNKV